MISDEAAYKRYLGGDEASAAVLVERYGDALTLYINRYVRDMYESEDLMIESFSRIFSKARPISDDSGMFRAYLYKIARNLALRHAKRRHVPLSFEDELTHEPCDDTEAHTALFKSERERQLTRAISRLKSDYRDALYLVYFEEMSYRDAARIMQRSEAQLTKLVYRGKQSLRAMLEKEGFDLADD